MKILLIQQDLGQRKIKFPLYPIGLSYLAAVLTKHEVKIFDPNVYDYPACLKVLREELIAFQPDIVGISIRNVDTTLRKDLFVNFNTVKPTLDVVRQVAPDARIVAGGAGFSIHAREIMLTVPEIEFGVYLEGEESFPELLDNLDVPQNVLGIFYRQKGELLFSGKRKGPDFSALPMPRRDSSVIDMRQYLGPLDNIVGVQGKRGCAFSCSYCTYVLLNQTKLRLRNPVLVVDEIEQLVNTYGVKGFAFVDSVFNMPESHAREICQEIIRRKIKVSWRAWLTPLKLTEDFLFLMREAGCKHIGISPDAVTDRGLKELEKSFSIDDIEKSLQMARKVKGVHFGYNFFCAYPGMSWSEVWKTIVMFFRIPLNLPGRGGVGLGWIRVEPNTKIFESAIKEGIMQRDMAHVPKNEKELAQLFYVSKTHWGQTLLFDSLLFVVDKVLKPVVAVASRLIGRFRGSKNDK